MISNKTVKIMRRQDLYDQDKKPDASKMQKIMFRIKIPCKKFNG
jgi:hypothetical protein